DRHCFSPVHAKVQPAQDCLLTKRLAQIGDLDRGPISAFVHGCSYPQMVRINRTSTTSARMTNSDERTTALMADLPTPSVPPRVRMPAKQATVPIISPNTAVLRLGGMKSLNVTLLKPLSKKSRREMGSARAF